MSRIQWYIGCSGFSYREWKDVFYPKGLAQKFWFEHYAKHFNTLELNVTFYRFPELKFLQSWQSRSPDHFIFSVKAPKLITHQKKFTDTANLLNDFYDVLMNGLGDKLGPVLFQLPPSFHFSTERLSLIVSQLNTTFNNVIEFRHNSWWRKEVMEALGEQGITFCGASYPGILDDVVVNTSSPYYRFHGVPQLYHSSYSDDFIKKVITHIGNAAIVQKGFLYFNNTASAAALSNAAFAQQCTNDNTFS